jgi:hypothetical protein
MAQVKWQSCPDPRRPQPDLTPPDIGTYTVEEKFKCTIGGTMTDDVRRRDVPRPKWATRAAGTPTVTHGPPLDNVAGLASLDVRPTVTVPTEQGPICVPMGPTRDVSWMPTVADLRGAPYVDTRRTAISDRYYR